MQNIIIDKEFKGLLPPLDKDTYKSLEENIIANGCIYPLVTWDGILIDGHNRYEICNKHGIPFETIEKVFKSREDVLIWIISNQVARRNLTPTQLSYYRGLHYNTSKVTKRRNQYTSTLADESAEPENLVQQKKRSTARDLAKHYKVSHDTIFTDSKMAAAIDSIGDASAEAKRMILSGEVRIEKQELARLSSATEDEIKAVAEEIENGEYAKREPDTQAQSGPDKTIDKILAALSPSAVIEKAPDTLVAESLKLADTSDKAELKAALRAYIDRLEDLYRRL